MPTNDRDADNPPRLSPFKPVSSNERKRLQQCFEVGRRGAETGNSDYAIEMFSECLRGDPGNLVYGQHMLGVLIHKYKTPKGVGRLAGLKATPVRGALLKAKMKDDWPTVLLATLDLLKINPWDVTGLTSMADVCLLADSSESQIFFLKKAHETNPKDADLNRLVGAALGRVGEFDRAILYWKRVLQARPEDEEARRAISALSVEKTIVDGKLSRGELNTDRRTDDENDDEPDAADATNDAAADPRSTEDRLQAAIAADPGNLALYRELADHHLGADRPDLAEQLLGQALALTGSGDLALRQRMEDCRIQQAQRQLARAERQAQQLNSDDAEQLVQQMKADLNRVELEVYAARGERSPGNLSWQFELGLRLKRAGQFQEAIKVFQQARQDSRRKPLILIELGECFQYIRQYKLAMANYDQAVGASQNSDESTRKLSLYRAGVLAMGMENWEIAEGYLTELGGIDFGFKDVAARLDKLAEIGNKG